MADWFVCICDTVCVKLGIELGALINVAVDFDGGLVCMHM
jgi:hypothetical protein